MLMQNHIIYRRVRVTLRRLYCNAMSVIIMQQELMWRVEMIAFPLGNRVLAFLFGHRYTYTYVQKGTRSTLVYNESLPLPPHENVPFSVFGEEKHKHFFSFSSLSPTPMWLYNHSQTPSPSLSDDHLNSGPHSQQKHRSFPIIFPTPQLPAKPQQRPPPPPQQPTPQTQQQPQQPVLPTTLKLTIT